MSSKRRVAVVTGATGHLGANLIRSLVAHGWDVVATVRGDARAVEGVPVRRVHADLLDERSLERAFAGAEVVFHLAAMLGIEGGDAELMWRVNLDGSLTVARAAMSAGIRRMVHASSIQALDPEPADDVVDERRQLRLAPSADPYGRSKAAAEQALLPLCARGLEVVVVTPTAVIGPHDYKLSPLGQVLRSVFRGHMPASVSGGFDWVDVRDVAEGTVAAAELGRPGERYLLGGWWATYHELATIAARVAGKRPPAVVSPTWLALLSAPVVERANRAVGRRALFTSDAVKILGSYRWIDSSRAKRELGYRPRSLVQTLQDTHRWHRSRS